MSTGSPPTELQEESPRRVFRRFDTPKQDEDLDIYIEGVEETRKLLTKKNGEEA